MIPGDGEIIEGVASVDESAITGESAPGHPRGRRRSVGVTGGTKVLSDWIVVTITSNPGETFLDRMIALVEGAVRQKTPNEIALNILLAVLTLIFLLVVVTLEPFANYAGHEHSDPGADRAAGLPDPDDHRRVDLGDRHRRHGPLVQHNVLAMSGRSVEAAGDVDTLLLDKTGTITLGNRQATDFRPAPGVSDQTLADAAQLASLADETPEGVRSSSWRRRSSVSAAGSSRRTTRRSCRSRRTRACRVSTSMAARFARARVDAIERLVKEQGNTVPAELQGAGRAHRP